MLCNVSLVMSQCIILQHISFTQLIFSVICKLQLVFTITLLLGIPNTATQILMQIKLTAKYNVLG